MSRGIVTPDWFTDTGIVTGPAEKIIRYLAQPGICPGKPQGCPAVGDYHLWIGTPESGTMSAPALYEVGTLLKQRSEVDPLSRGMTTSLIRRIRFYGT